MTKFLTSLFLLIPLYLWAEGEQPYPISWDAVAGTGGYVVEVQNDHGETVINRSLTENRVTLNLVPGAYSFRLTTLNRFKRAEAVTEWYSFHVLAPKPPVFVGINPGNVLKGKPQIVEVAVENLSREGSLTLQSPSGKEIALTIDDATKPTLRIELPALDETGKYSLVLLNPPKQSTTAESVLEVGYPDPTIASLVPDNFQADQEPESLDLAGSDFSPEAALILTVNKKPVELTILSRTDGDIVFALPKKLRPGEYHLSLRNFPGAALIDGPSLVISPAPKKPRKLTEHNLLITLGWLNPMPLGTWRQLYGASPYNLELGVDYYFTKDRVPSPKAEFNVGLRLGISAADFSSQQVNNFPFVDSNLLMFSGTIAPSFELTTQVIRVRFYPGIGLNYSNINTWNQGYFDTRESMDILLFGRVALDVQIFQFLRLEGIFEYRHYFMTEPLDTIAVGAGLVVAIGVNRGNQQ